MSKIPSPSTPRKYEDISKPAAHPVPVSPNGRAADAKSPPSTSSKPPAVTSPPASPVAKRAVSEAPSAAGAESDDEQPENEADELRIIDLDIFQQILELDEDDEREFSKEMVWQYFEQASSTFKDMDVAFEAKELLKLSNLGHFLKGSSAALGVSRVQATCEKIQNYGKLWDEEHLKELSEKDALKKIEPLLKTGKKEYTDAEKWLRTYYKEPGVNGPPNKED